jgi:hypothetical protein
MSEILSIFMFYFLIEKMENVVQVLQPWIQTRKFANVRHKYFIVVLLKHLKKRALGRLLKDNGEPDEGVIDKLVH